MVLLSLETISDLLSEYQFTADQYVESDGSITLSLHEIDLIGNGKDEKAARKNLGESISEGCRYFF